MNRTAAVLLILLIAAGASAAERFPHGRWMIGVDGVRSVVDDELDDTTVEEESSGVGFQIGYLLQPRLQLRIYTSSADHATGDEGVDLNLDGATLDIVYLFRAAGAFRPYLSGGGGGFGARSQRGALAFEAEGMGVALGAGFHLHVNRRLALHAQARLESINWDTARATLQLPGGGTSVLETPMDDSGSAFKLGVGGAIWF